MALPFKITTKDKLHHNSKAEYPNGAKAADFTRKLCEGKTVKVETDVRKFDKYGRLLAYIYLFYDKYFPVHSDLFS